MASPVLTKTERTIFLRLLCIARDDAKRPNLNDPPTTGHDGNRNAMAGFAVARGSGALRQSFHSHSLILPSSYLSVNRTPPRSVSLLRITTGSPANGPDSILTRSPIRVSVG